MFESLKELLELKKSIEQKLKTDGQEALKTAFSKFFETYPNVKGFYWNQYTPYFNDGDECEFRVNELYIGLDEGDENTPVYTYDSSYSSFKKGDPQKPEREIMIGDELVGFFSSVKDSELNTQFEQLASILGEMESTLLFVFGNHVEITVSREKIEVDEYSHE